MNKVVITDLTLEQANVFLVTPQRWLTGHFYVVLHRGGNSWSFGRMERLQYLQQYWRDNPETYTYVKAEEIFVNE